MAAFEDLPEFVEFYAEFKKNQENLDRREYLIKERDFLIKRANQLQEQINSINYSPYVIYDVKITEFLNNYVIKKYKKEKNNG